MSILQEYKHIQDDIELEADEAAGTLLEKIHQFQTDMKKQV